MLADLSVADLSARLRGGGLLLRMGPFVLRLGTSLDELVDPIALLYAHHEVVAEGGIVDFDIRVEPMTGPRRWIRPLARHIIDGRPQFDPFPRSLALPMMEWAINWCTFMRPHFFLLLHSVVVEHGGRAMLLPGPPGAGKSTLCAALALRGWRLLSDEMAVFRPPAIDLIPVPRPVGLKEESIEVVRRFDPSAVIGPACPGTHKGTVAHLRPPADSIRRCQETARPRWIVFPAYTPGAEVALVPTGKAQTFVHVADDAFNFSLLGRLGFEMLSAVVDACDCYELTYGDLGQAVAALTQLADETASDRTGSESLSCEEHPPA